ncbi:hypothetical protein PO909_000887 [Leuciscus waleckii]
MNLFHRLHLEGRHHNKLRATDILRFNSVHSLQSHESCAEEELVQTFIQKLLMMNYRARYIKSKETNEESHNEQGSYDLFRQEADSDDFFLNLESVPNEDISKSERIHPMDVQMAVFTCADGLLKQLMVTKLSHFQNSLEISTYSKLETEYSKWSWCLRKLKKTSEEVERSMSEFFDKDKDKDNDLIIQWKTSFYIKIKDVQENIVRETKRKLNEILQQRDLKKKIDAQRTDHENTLYEKIKELALKRKDKTNDEETLKKAFDSFWEQSVNRIVSDTSPLKDIDIMRDVRDILSDVYESAPVDHIKENSEFTKIFTLSSYCEYVIFKKSTKKTVTEVVKGAYRKVKKTFGYSRTLSPEKEAEIKSLITDVAQQTEKMIQSYNISNNGYKISYIQQLIVYSVCKRANKMITDQHTLFRESIYVKKRAEYYSIFQNFCNGATSTAIFGEIICQKLKEPIEQSVYKKTARYLTDEIMKNCESLNGNRSKLEKHILKTLAEEEDFDKYMNYVDNPRDHFKIFIRDEVSRYITDKFSPSVLPKMKENIKLLQQKIMKAAHESTEHVQVNSGDVGLWLKSFTRELSDELIFSEKDLRAVKHDDVDDFSFLEDVIREELPAVMSEISSGFNTKTFPVNLDYKFRPDELLIEHFCQCCWVQCPFCGAVCTNTIENHHGDHSVAFHRSIGLNEIYCRNTSNLSTHICTSAVASKTLCFHPNDSDDTVLYREYRRAGGVYADWSITPDLSELPYWKWFVCRFQKDLEKQYNKTFEGCVENPSTDEWKKYSKQEAIESLNKNL